MKKKLLFIAVVLITNCSFAQCESLLFLRYTRTYAYSGITYYMQSNVHKQDRDALFNWFLKERFLDWNDIGNKCVHIGEKGHNNVVVTVVLKQAFFTGMSDQNQKDELFLAASNLSTGYLHKKVTIVGISSDKQHKAEASCDY